MGTRGLWGFRVGGVDKVTYNHFDSYPSGLGVVIVNFINSHDLISLLNIADRISMVNSNSIPTKMQIKECKEWLDLGVGEQKKEDWYCLLRGSQGDPTAYDRGLSFMIDSQTFIFDSLFCEWAYFINLDTVKFEVWKGFQHEPTFGNRYGCERDNEYYPCKMIAEFDLHSIPGNWMETPGIEDD